MKRSKLFFVALVCGRCLVGCQAQPPFGSEYLKLEKVIPLAGVKGRIDHLDCNAKDKIIYVAALGNNSLEIVGLDQGKVLHSIHGLDEPQGVAYVPQYQEILVANGGNGKCNFFNALNFQPAGTIDLGSDADDVRYDSVTQKLYVGYGSGGIAVIDAASHQVLGKALLPVHPESFQLLKSANKIFVNLPDANMIAVVDADKLKIIDKWKRDHLLDNYPMTLDQSAHHVIIGYRSPAVLEINSETGKSLHTYAMVGDADDLYYDESRKRAYIGGGEGRLDIFQEEPNGSYKEIASIESRRGARTSLFVPSLQLWIVAARAQGRNEASLLVYSVVK
ncbi:MAG: hypothetical protein C5B59_07295 [Bacteroidetes bacterium]|nr:MAG: hypothetical protein C5B59_07295 [Bacteroidota bacterium]